MVVRTASYEHPACKDAKLYQPKGKGTEPLEKGCWSLLQGRQQLGESVLYRPPQIHKPFANVSCTPLLVASQLSPRPSVPSPSSRGSRAFLSLLAAPNAKNKRSLTVNAAPLHLACVTGTLCMYRSTLLPNHIAICARVPYGARHVRTLFLLQCYRCLLLGGQGTAYLSHFRLRVSCIMEIMAKLHGEDRLASRLD